MLELECEITSGPPGTWKEIGEGIQGRRHDLAPTQSHDTSMPDMGDIVARRGEAAIVAAIDRGSHPPSFVIRILQSGREINCERHDFLAKGDPRLIAHEMNSWGDELSQPRDMGSC